MGEGVRGRERMWREGEVVQSRNDCTELRAQSLGSRQLRSPAGFVGTEGQLRLDHTPPADPGCLLLP